ncbi:DUF1211 domain-containing protein [Chloroflexia bacterium SDU3-3]|nr:DUF1211 domain-containing protein [Chloroflexia bacterium SDU3-3]
MTIRHKSSRILSTYVEDVEDSEKRTPSAERLVAFSDAVIAIVITLLVLEIKVPHVEEGGNAALTMALLNQWPSYLSFIVSFMIIGVTWANHHTMFAHIKRTDHMFLLINLLFLFWIAAIPFASALLGEYIQRPEEQTAAVVYGGVLTIGGVFFNLIWVYATGPSNLVDRKSNPVHLRALRHSFMFGPVLYFLVTLVAFWNVEVSLACYILLGLLYAMPLASFRHLLQPRSA